MKVKELIEKLQEFNQDAEVLGIYDYVGYPLYWVSFGGGDGCTKENCDDVHLLLSEDNNTECTGTI
jgi:hypothetical protein